MENQNKLWDELVELQYQLEENQDQHEDTLEIIFFIKDSMRGGYDMTEEIKNILKINAK